MMLLKTSAKKRLLIDKMNKIFAAFASVSVVLITINAPMNAVAQTTDATQANAVSYTHLTLPTILLV